MTYIVIGSTALHRLFPELVREPKDLDVFWDKGKNGFDVSPEVTPDDPFWDDRLYEWFGYSTYSADLDELYTIKVSHAQWDLRNDSWTKHIGDIIFMQNHGAKLIPELHDLLYKIWIDVHGKKKMTFSESEEFFADAVVRKYDHDSLHESVAYGDHALYLDYLLPGRSVAMDMARVWSSPHEALVKLFREEIYATALERLLVPRNYRISPGFAYRWALRRTVTSLTKGKSSRWLLENIQDFWSPSDPFGDNYVQRHLRKSDKLIPLEVNA